MKKYCEKCKKEFSETSKKCPLCGKRLKKIPPVRLDFSE